MNSKVQAAFDKLTKDLDCMQDIFIPYYGTILPSRKLAYANEQNKAIYTVEYGFIKNLFLESLKKADSMHARLDQFNGKIIFYNDVMDAMVNGKKWCSTACVDSNHNLYFSVSFIMNRLCTVERLTAVIMHELSHIVFNHFDRLKNYEKTKGHLFVNCVQDEEINTLLVKRGVISKAVFDEIGGLCHQEYTGMACEQIAPIYNFDGAKPRTPGSTGTSGNVDEDGNTEKGSNVSDDREKADKEKAEKPQKDADAAQKAADAAQKAADAAQKAADQAAQDAKNNPGDQKAQDKAQKAQSAANQAAQAAQSAQQAADQAAQAAKNGDGQAANNYKNKAQHDEQKAQNNAQKAGANKSDIGDNSQKTSGGQASYDSGKSNAQNVADKAQQAANAAQNAASAAQKAADKSGDAADQKAADDAQQAADDAQQAADQAQRAAESGDTSSAKVSRDEARADEQKAREKAKEAGASDDDMGNDSQNGGGDPQSGKPGEPNGDNNGQDGDDNSRTISDDPMGPDGDDPDGNNRTKGPGGDPMGPGGTPAGPGGNGRTIGGPDSPIGPGGTPAGPGGDDDDNYGYSPRIPGKDQTVGGTVDEKDVPDEAKKLPQNSFNHKPQAKGRAAKDNTVRQISQDDFPLVDDAANSIEYGPITAELAKAKTKLFKFLQSASTQMDGAAKNQIEKQNRRMIWKTKQDGIYRKTTYVKKEFKNDQMIALLFDDSYSVNYAHVYHCCQLIIEALKVMKYKHLIIGRWGAGSDQIMVSEPISDMNKLREAFEDIKPGNVVADLNKVAGKMIKVCKENFPDANIDFGVGGMSDFGCFTTAVLALKSVYPKCVFVCNSDFAVNDSTTSNNFDDFYAFSKSRMHSRNGMVFCIPDSADAENSLKTYVTTLEKSDFDYENNVYTMSDPLFDK